VDAFQKEAADSPSGKEKGQREVVRKRNLTVVVHDWAVVPGLHYANTRGCENLVLLDVIPGARPTAVSVRALHTSYQVGLSCSSSSSFHSLVFSPRANFVGRV
jgi:hypothetical protein